MKKTVRLAIREMAIRHQVFSAPGIFDPNFDIMRINCYFLISSIKIKWQWAFSVASSVIDTPNASASIPFRPI